MQNSWNAMKKDLEENLICDGLRGRVRYMLKSNNKKMAYVKVDREERNVEIMTKKRFLQNTEVKSTTENNGFALTILEDAVREYKGSNINKSLNSSNFIIRMLAIMDKRVTKNILEKLSNEVKLQPEWLKYFYKLRFDVEQIPYAEEAEENTEVLENVVAAEA